MKASAFAAEGALVVAAFLFGVTFPLVHDALDDVTPFAYLVVRFGIAALVLAPFAIPALRARGEDRRLLVRVGVIAGVLLFGGYATQTVGLQYTSPSTSAFITGLYVIFTPFIEAAVSRAAAAPRVIVGIVIATVGLYLLTGADLGVGRGELLTLACAVLFACGSCTRARTPTRCTRSRSRPCRCAVALLSVGTRRRQQGVGSLSTLAVFAIVFTGIACSAVALSLQLWGQRRIPPTRAALILLMEPVFAGIAGYVDGERLGPVELVGRGGDPGGDRVGGVWPRRSVPRPRRVGRPVTG